MPDLGLAKLLLRVPHNLGIAKCGLHTSFTYLPVVVVGCINYDAANTHTHIRLNAKVPRKV